MEMGEIVGWRRTSLEPTPWGEVHELCRVRSGFLLVVGHTDPGLKVCAHHDIHPPSSSAVGRDPQHGSGQKAQLVRCAFKEPNWRWRQGPRWHTPTVGSYAGAANKLVHCSSTTMTSFVLVFNVLRLPLVLARVKCSSARRSDQVPSLSWSIYRVCSCYN